MQVVSIQEGQFSISASNTQGYDVSFGNQCEGQIQVKEIKTCLITLNDKGTTLPPPPPPLLERVTSRVINVLSDDVAVAFDESFEITR